MIMYKINILFLILLFSCADKESKKSDNIPWYYFDETNKMDNSKQYVAYTISKNYLNFKFPYNGGSFFYLVLKNKDGNHVLLYSENAHFIRDSYIKVKFDDEEPIDFWYKISAYRSNDAIFIDESEEFIEKLKKSNKVMIEVPFYDNGRKIIEFDTYGLTWYFK